MWTEPSPMQAMREAILPHLPPKAFLKRDRGEGLLVTNAPVFDPGLCEIPGFILCDSAEKAVEMTKNDENVFVIGGGSIYRQMLPYCETAYITKLSAQPESDTFFPNLDEDPEWVLTGTLQGGEENGITYEMCRYERISKDGCELQ